MEVLALKNIQPRRFILFKLPVYAALLAVLFGFSVETTQQPEYKVKAVFLYNFSHFVQWPQDVFPKTESSFVIGILGEDPFQQHLEKAIEGEKIQNHGYEIRFFSSVKEVANCHILFISERNKEKYGQILTALKGKPILTVGDSRNFADMGGMIQFVQKDSKINLRINHQSAVEAHLQVSPKLLKLAEIVPAKDPDIK